MRYYPSLALAACVVLLSTGSFASDTSDDAAVVPEATATNLMEENSKTLSKAQAVASAKSEYYAAMAEMQSLSNQLGHMSEDYDRRAEKQGRAAERGAQKERLQAMSAMLAPAGAANQEVLQELPEGSDGRDVLAEAMKHKEVQEMEDEMEAEHASGNPLEIAGKQLAHEKQLNREKAMSHQKWNALRYGWTPFKGELDPDEQDVEAEAHILELNLEAEGKTKLSQAQKDAIVAAVREHDKSQNKIKMAQARVAQMKGLVEEDDRRARKEKMRAQAEALYTEQDGMNLKVKAAQQRVKTALARYQMAVAAAEEDP